MKPVEICHFDIILVRKVFYYLVYETSFFFTFPISVYFVLEQIKIWQDSIKANVVDLLKEFAGSWDIGLHLLCFHDFFINLKLILDRFEILSE